MRPEIQQIIDRKNMEYKAVKTAKEENEKLKLLDRMGLFEIEYAEPKVNEYGYYFYTPEDCANYPFVETNSDGKMLRYKKVYTDVTDEEYEALLNIAELMPEKKEESVPDTISVKGYQSGLASFMVGLAIMLYLAFFILGIVMGNNSVASYLSSRSEFSFGTALLFWVIGVFAGTMMLGFAHIVDHLYKQTILLNKISKDKK